MIKYLVLFSIFLLVSPVRAQTFTLSGYIYDAVTNEVLIGATVYDSLSGNGTSSNKYGFYSLSLDSEAKEISVSYIGYSLLVELLNYHVNTTRNFSLAPAAEELNEIVVSSDKGFSSNITKRLNITTLTPLTLQKYPIIFGESDVIKALQLQPGVTTLGEGSSGLFVQGGKADQNLMLIDEAPIYNASHLFGLVSVFNPDALKKVSFYKSPIPAEYGGKISSVIDAQMKDGNKQGFGLSGGIGTLTAHLALEGPIIKNKASYLVAIRRSIRDLLGISASQFNPKFYDLNVKLNWNTNPKNRFFVSFYNGQDKLNDDDFVNTWGNTTLTTRWVHQFGAKLFANLSLIYSDYQNDREFTEPGKEYHWLTGVNDITGKLTFSWFLNPNNELRFGLESISHRYVPGENELPESSLFRVNAIESAAYILHDININRWLGLNYGIRGAIFQNVNEGHWYDYDGFVPVELNHNESGVYNTYTSIEPRVSLNIKPNKNGSIKVGYTKTAQFSQVMQNTLFSYSALQTWLPSGPNIKPLYANIFTAGYYGKADLLSYSFEGYYKKIDNIIDYIDHAQLINNPFIEGQIRTGLAKSYGASLEIKRESENLRLAFAYTYSRVINTIDGINNGKAYSALHDIPHDIKISVYYKPINRIGISGYWSYHTGFAATFPIGYVNGNGSSIPIYGERNDSRMPNYHRLDLAVNLLPKKGVNRWKSTWSAGVYNAYSRLNPMGVDFNRSTATGVSVYTLYRIVPYISYNFKF